MKIFRTGLVALAMTCAAAVAQAASITSYDVTNANVSGTGGWSHVYSGTITPNGLISAYDGQQLANYSGGGGTLNNGTGTSPSDAQLFAANDNPTITLYLDGFYTLNDIRLETWAGGNAIPGSITGFTASIGATSDSFLPADSTNRSEFASFGGSALDGVATNTLVLSNFTSSYFSSAFAISNIVINGDAAQGPSTIPLPAGGLLLVSAFGGTLMLRRRKSS